MCVCLRSHGQAAGRVPDVRIPFFESMLAPICSHIYLPFVLAVRSGVSGRKDKLYAVCTTLPHIDRVFFDVQISRARLSRSSRPSTARGARLGMS